MQDTIFLFVISVHLLIVIRFYCEEQQLLLSR